MIINIPTARNRRQLRRHQHRHIHRRVRFRYILKLHDATACSPTSPKLEPDRITAILTSRFLLALQEANRTVVRVDLDLDRGDRPLHSSAGWGDQYDSAPSFISSLGGFVNPDLAESASWDGDGDEGYGRHGNSCEEEGEETRDSDSVLNEIETMKSV